MNGFWLGVLRDESFSAIDEEFYNDARLYRSREYNMKGLSKWEREMLERYFTNARRLLLIGAGGGRETIALLRNGYEVDAFECNPTLRHLGNQFLSEEGFDPCIGLVDRDTCPQGRGIYDGAVIGWGAYMLIRGSDRRSAFLKQVRSTLREGSPILLSFYTRQSDSWGLRKTVMIGNFFRSLLGRKKLELGDSLAPNYVHYFSEPELVMELSNADFAMEYYSTNSYGHAVAFATITEPKIEPRYREQHLLARVGTNR